MNPCHDREDADLVVRQTSHPNAINSSIPSTSPASTSNTNEPESRPRNRVQNQNIRSYCVSRRHLNIGQIKKINHQLLKFIVTGYHPFSVVDEPEFKNLVALLSPNYTGRY